MRVCLSTLEYPPFFGGGIATYYQMLAQGLASEGCDVTVLTTISEESSYFEQSENNIHVIRVPAKQVSKWENKFVFFRHSLPETFRLLSHSQALTEKLAELHQRVSLDIVESPEVQCLNSMFSDQHELSELPTVVAIHGGIRWSSENEPPECHSQDKIICEEIELLAVQNADGLIASARDSQNYWEGRVHTPIKVVLPPFKALTHCERPAHTIELPEKYILVVGRLQSWKGIQDLAGAFMRIKDRCPELNILSVGKDTNTFKGGTSMLDHLRKMLGNLWQTRWHWIPSLPPPELAWIRKKALMAVCPSRWEAFGYTVPEAMGDGKPVIVSDGAGVADICADGENALLFPKGDVDSLSECIKRLWEDAVLRERLIEGGHRTIQNELDLARTTRERILVYKQVIDATQKEGGRMACNRNSVYEEILNHLATHGRIPALLNYRASELMSELGRRAGKKWRKSLHVNRK